VIVCNTHCSVAFLYTTTNYDSETKNLKIGESSWRLAMDRVCVTAFVHSQDKMITLQFQSSKWQIVAHLKLDLHAFAVHTCNMKQHLVAFVDIFVSLILCSVLLCTY